MNNLAVKQESIAQPQDITIIDQQPDRLIMAQAWRSNLIVNSVIAIVVGVLGLVVAFFFLLTFVPFFAPFLIPLAIVTIYLPITGIVNKTTITVANGEIAITHGPLWTYRRSLRLPLNSIHRLSIERRFYRFEYFVLNAQLSNGETIRLVDKLPYQNVAIFLEQKLTNYLALIK